MLQEVAKFCVNPMLYVWAGLLTLLFLKNVKRRYLIGLNVLFYVVTIPFTGWVFHQAWRVDDTFNPNLTYDAVIVLTGIADDWYVQDKKPYDDLKCYYRFNDNAERILAGVSFVKHGQAKRLLLGEHIWKSFNETDLLTDFALQNGLRPGEITVYGEIERTLDEAREVKAFIRKNPLARLMLVTSESHMRRALGLFRKQGVEPDVHSVEKGSTTFLWDYLIPSPQGAQGTKDSLYELVGYIGYLLKGDI